MDITGVAVSFNHDIMDLKINPDNTDAPVPHWDNTDGKELPREPRKQGCDAII